MNNNPKITVLMSVYNGDEYLQEAIDSILNQTFTNFEFLIIDDGCTDRSVEIINSYSDHRIRLVQNETNLGLIASLNKGLDLANGKYIARMDADDVSLPERLIKQVTFMNRNPHIGICGTWTKTFGKPNSKINALPTDPEIVKSSLLFNSALAHPTVMLRTDMLLQNNLFYNDVPHAEDYELWVRASKLFPLANLPEVLLLYRVHTTKVGIRFGKEQQLSTNKVRLDQLNQLEIIPSVAELALHNAIGSMNFTSSQQFVKDAEEWLKKIESVNLLKRIYYPPALSAVLSKFWFDICNTSSRLGLWTWKTFFNSPLSKSVSLTFDQKLRFAARCGLHYGIR